MKTFHKNMLYSTNSLVFYCNVGNSYQNVNNNNNEIKNKNHTRYSSVGTYTHNIITCCLSLSYAHNSSI